MGTRRSRSGDPTTAGFARCPARSGGHQWSAQTRRERYLQESDICSPPWAVKENYWFVIISPTVWDESYGLLDLLHHTDQLSMVHLSTTTRFRLYPCKSPEWGWLKKGNIFILSTLFRKKILTKQWWSSEINSCSIIVIFQIRQR